MNLRKHCATEFTPGDSVPVSIKWKISCPLGRVTEVKNTLYLESNTDCSVIKPAAASLCHLSYAALLFLGGGT
jgi:hypothetical protein